MRVKDLCALHQHRSREAWSNHQPEQDTRSVLKPATGDEATRGEGQHKKAQRGMLIPRETGDTLPTDRKANRHTFELALDVSTYLNNLFFLPSSGGEEEQPS